MVEITQTRILSVAVWYHLAFFVVSAAMFGMTAGAVWIYLRGQRYTRESLSADLSSSTAAFAISTGICLCVQMTIVPDLILSVSSIFALAEITLLMATPFFFSGMAVCLALTRSPFPIGRVYAVDLIGAGAGCLGVLAVLNFVDAPSAVFLASGGAALAAVMFRRAGLGGVAEPRGLLGRLLSHPGTICVLLVAAGLINSRSPLGVRPMLAKGVLEVTLGAGNDTVQWNSFSRVVTGSPGKGAPRLWGPSPKLPPDLQVEAISMNIDGLAGTRMFRFSGDLDQVDFLTYDVTNLAYFIRNQGRSAVIGVGGGRDLLSAYKFGFRDITGVEINPIFIHLLTKSPLHRQFAGLANIDGIKFRLDEARSWFARSKEQFDLVQMSMIDTWAASNAGAFTLTENGLYTVEAWRVFLGRLNDRGIYTVSRWYGLGEVNETGRMMSLAVASLLELGVPNPRQHIFVGGTDRVATLLLAKSPLTSEEISTLRKVCADREYRVLISPDATPESEVLRTIVHAANRAELESYTSHLALDLTPPTDDRPFFFNLLPLSRPLQVFRYGDWRESGIHRGNLVATLTLLLILLVSMILVLLTIVFPLRASLRQAGGALVWGGTGYFLLLGMGFMFVEIGLLQRLSVFLGHPIYSLSVVLFSVIVATGVGSFISGKWPILNRSRFVAWSIGLGLYLLLLPLWLPDVIAWFASAATPVRALISVLVILPAGILMGFGFPTGMSLVERHDARPAPWFWGINGAGGVFASVSAIAVSIAFSIDVTIFLGGVCYLALMAFASLIGFGADPGGQPGTSPDLARV